MFMTRENVYAFLHKMDTRVYPSKAQEYLPKQNLVVTYVTNNKTRFNQDLQ